MDLEARNKILCDEFAAGKPMTKISKEYGISPTHLSRIFKKYGIKRKKFELDKEFFESNKDKTARQISDETGICIKRVSHLKRIAYGHKPKNKNLDYSNIEPTVDPKLIDNFEWVYDQYVNKMFGAPTIAKKLGTKTTKVVKRLKEFGISLRNINKSMSCYQNRPDKNWIIEYYIDKKFSIEKCSEIYGCSFTTMQVAIKEHGFKTRSASEQHIGELNEFYGKRHPDNIKQYCIQMGSYYGSKLLDFRKKSRGINKDCRIMQKW
jgi:hypothetical protein